jgi:Serine carboxypeptidase
MPIMAKLSFVPYLQSRLASNDVLSSQGTTEEAAKDIGAFVVIFFENFSKFKGRGFHMAGESYGVSTFSFVHVNED